MAQPSELNSDGLLIAYYSNIKRQRELRAEQKALEAELEARYGLLMDKYRRGDIEIIQENEGGNK
jgi:hypothetical protein